MPSNWNSVQGVRENLAYAHWPNPFNTIKNIRTLACDPNIDLLVEFAFPLIAEFWWTNFFPSPREVFRHFVFGQYMCGVKMFPSQKSPMELVWGRGTRTVIVSILRPAATGLWAWWVTATAFEALSTWSSIVYAMENCDQEPNTAVSINWDGEKVGLGGGQPVGADSVWDPNHWLNPANTGYDIPSGSAQVFSTWHLTNLSNGPVSGEIWVNAGNKGEGEHVPFQLGLGATADLSAEFSGAGGDASVHPEFDVLTGPSLPRVDFRMSRWYLAWQPESPVPPPKPFRFGDGPPCPKCLDDIFGH